MSTSTSFQLIAVDLIDVQDRLRHTDQAKVVALAELFAVEGHRSPVSVSGPDKDGRFLLIYGAHRLAAVRHLGASTIMAQVLPPNLDTDETRLAEITENVARFELTILDRSFAIAEWRAIWERRNGKIKAGRPKKKLEPEVTISTPSQIDAAGERFSGSFSDAAQTVFGLTRQHISKALKIATIASKIRQILAQHPISNSTQNLMLLADQDAARQAEIAKLLTIGAVDSVHEAITQIDGAPASKPISASDKLSGAFSRLKKRDQFAFFDLHEAAVEEWWIERKRTNK